MKNIKLKLVISMIIVIAISLVSYMYTEFYGYPWKHAAMKKEAIHYMKDKYNMDVKVESSTFNFKFNYYIVQVFNVNDAQKILISVEKQKFYDEQSQFKGERLEDNYNQIYWEHALASEMQARFPKFFNHSDIKQFEIDIAYYTTPLNGVSSTKDEQGILIPLKPEHSFSIEIDLKTNDFPDDFVNEIFIVMNDLLDMQLKADLFITAASKSNENNDERTKVLRVPYEKLEVIHNVDDLYHEISEF